MAAHQPRPVPNFAFISFANLPREKREEGIERGRGKTDYTFMLHILPFPSLPLPWLSLLPFWHLANAKGKIAHKMRRNLQRSLCVNWVICNAPRDPFPSPSPSHGSLPTPFPLWLFVLVFYYSMLPATFSSYIHKFISFVFPSSLALPRPAPRQSTEACPYPYFGSYSPKLLPFGNLHLQFHEFLQIYTFVGVLFYWVSSLVSIRFLTRGGGAGGGHPLNGV